MAKLKLGVLVDRLWAMREEIRADEAKLAKKKLAYGKEKAKVMQDYDKEEVGKAAGTKGQASLVYKHIYRVKDQFKFLDAVRKKKAWHLLKAGLNADEFKAHVEELPAKKRAAAFPGVELFTDVSLHITSVMRGKRKAKQQEDDE
jgi:hypothetical protein